jgi:asparaginyl-tRNA synthetase
MRTKIRQILLASDPGKLVGQEHTVKGWVKTIRVQKNLAFIEVNDGSSFNNLQIVVESTLPNFQKDIASLGTGASISALGVIEQSPGQNQALELRATQLKVLGTADQEKYPLQKKRHSFEFLRSVAHLRPRTNTFGAVARIRNVLAFATHTFFQNRGFLYIQTPVITTADCEGAGELFRVTTLDVENVPKSNEGHVDFTKDFFGSPSYLTCSGQLNAEAYACALSDVYTFGPTFRAENSNTARHLAEFWMIEPEMAFADIEDNMELAESYVKFLVSAVLEKCADDMVFFNQYIESGVIERLEKLVSTPFERATYTYAVRILEKSGKKFDFPVSWGQDLQSEHERFLTEEHFQKPVIITDYPRKIKAFYMRDNQDGKTVAAMDVLVPKIGEIIGGSQREEREDRLEAKMKEFGLAIDPYWWYLELRKYGTVPHAGFGAGFERLVRLVTGLDNIRDAIPFPRFPGSAQF